MENNPKQGKIRNINFYLPKAYKFYSLKKEFLTPVLFVIILLLGQLSFPDENTNWVYIVIKFIFFFITDLLFSIYLVTFLNELKGESTSLKSILLKIARKIFRIFCLSIIYYIFSSMVVTFIMLNSSVFIPLTIIPLIFIYLIFMLNICYVIDQNYSVYGSFTESKDSIEGYKIEILRVTFLFLFPIAVLTIFIFLIAGLSGNNLIFPFVLYFVYTIVRFMLQRFKALLYFDIEYSKREENAEDEF